MIFIELMIWIIRELIYGFILKPSKCLHSVMRVFQ